MAEADTMRAAVLHGPETLVVESVPVPEPAEGELRVRVEVALTGGTSTKVYRRGYHARMGQPPLRFGHEGVGVVDAIGPGVTTWKPGDRVVPANSAPCGRCRACERGHTAQCADMVWLGGFFAEQVIVPARIAAMNTHAVPDGLAPETAALSEILATVVKGHDRTPARRGERAVVIGTGPLGLMWVRVLANDGARVTAVGRRPDRGEIALALGAEAAVSSREFDAGNAEADLVIEAVGSIDAWATALEAAAPGARVHLFGGPPKGTTVALDTQRMHYDELTLTASFHHTPYHFAHALELLAAGFVDPALFVQERLTLAELPDHFARAAAGKGPLKAAVAP
jgi:L-iditol 2-dehydrogenase